MSLVMNEVSTAADAYSQPVSVRSDGTFSLHVFWTGTTAGVLKLEFSNKEFPAVSGASTDWYTSSTYVFPADPAGSASSVFEQWSGCAAKWVRLFYDRTSGSGLMTVYAHEKQF